MPIPSKLCSDREEQLFAEALALPLEERLAFIDRECGRDDASAKRLRSLLRGYQERSEFLDTPAVEAVLDSSGHARAAIRPEPAIGERIGRYRILERLGEGGFGVVYLAEQDEPVRRRVALKIIRLGLDTQEFVARFAAERQALALMQHPNIARVFDAGATETGRPFLVMELVHGTSITKYCDDHRLSLDARLKLFAQVCGAIQHAHQKGVIHRDLKPSNILVALEGAEPEVKVIDFGIAKATRERLTEKTLVTGGRLLMGTPVYTSPEQMEMSGLDVDTRSDIYSLGVLLYELLTGHPPFDRTLLQSASLEEMRRILREVVPPRPSARVSSLAPADRADVAAKREVDAEKLPALLRSDLDWIAMRCLEKDRTRRYETANGLALDLRRHLENEPVVARPPSRTYQLRKFVGRHRTAVAACAVVGLSLSGGLITSSVLLARARSAERAQAELRQRAEASAAEARVEAAKSIQVAQFMTDMLQGVAPGVARGRDTTLLSEVLDKTAERLDRELREQPAVAAKLHEMLGVVYGELGQYAKGESRLREAVALRRKLPAGAQADLASSLVHLGNVLWRLNRNVEAEALLREALAIRRRVLGNEHVDVAATLYHLSSPVGDLGRLDEYESLRREALAMRLRLLGNEHTDYALSLHGMGSVERIKGNLPEAEAFLREALAIRRKVQGNESPSTAFALNSLGFVLQGEGRSQEAIAAYREALSIRRRALNEIHPDMCVTVLRLAGLLSASGQRGEAIAITRENLAGQRKVAGSDAIETAPTLLALAALLGRDGPEAEEAREHQKNALRIFAHARSTGERVSHQASYSMFFFATTMLHAGVPSEGVVAADEAWQWFGSLFGADHEETLTAFELRAELQLATGNIAEATRLFEQARERAVALLPPNHQTLIRTLVGLGRAYRESGRLADSQRMLEDAVMPFGTGSTKPAAQLPANVTKGSVQCQLAWTLNAAGNFVGAEKILAEVLARSETGPESLVIAALAQSLLGEALTGEGRFAEAEQCVTQGYLGLRQNERAIPGNRAKEFRAAIDRVVRLYGAWQKPSEAVEWKSKGEELSSRSAP